jgi:hypothetical protein
MLDFETESWAYAGSAPTSRSISTSRRRVPGRDKYLISNLPLM